jgi:hypothetical protein
MTETIQRVTLIKGMTGFDIEFYVKDTSGTAIDISGSTINFRMSPVTDLETLKINGVCTIVSGPAGTCKYTAGATDFDTADVYIGQLKVTLLGGKVVIAQNMEFTVKENLGV